MIVFCVLLKSSLRTLYDRTKNKNEHRLPFLLLQLVSTNFANDF